MLSLDRELFFLLNGSDSLFWDGVWWTVSQIWIWFFFYITLLYVIIKYSGGWQITISLLLAICICVLMSDRISSGIFKPLFERWRPSRDPEIFQLVDIVNGYRGGRYGFVSSHAANTFGLATLLTLLKKSRSRKSQRVLRTINSFNSLSYPKYIKFLSSSNFFVFIIWIWALITSYSRIYLGVHYPSDIVGGALVGLFSGVFSWWMYCLVGRYWNLNISCAYPPIAFFLIVCSLLLTFLFIPFIGMWLV